MSDCRGVGKILWNARAVRRAVDTAISKARAEGEKVADKGKGKAMVGEGFGGPWVE